MVTVLGWFKGRVAKEITPKEIDDRLTNLTDKGLTGATRNRYRALVVDFINTVTLSVRGELVEPRTKSSPFDKLRANGYVTVIAK
jgi:hypothetical protein